MPDKKDESSIINICIKIKSIMISVLKFTFVTCTIIESLK